MLNYILRNLTNVSNSLQVQSDSPPKKLRSICHQSVLIYCAYKITVFLKNVRNVYHCNSDDDGDVGDDY